MAGNRVQYIIDLVVQDKQLRQQMAKVDWEKLRGSKGKGMSEVFTKGTKDAANQIQNTFRGLNIDWSKILGEKDLVRLETQLSKIISNKSGNIKSWLNLGDTKSAEEAINYIAELGNQLSGLGTKFDSGGLARSMGAFMKAIAPLANKTQDIEVAFGRLFNNTSAGINNTAKASEKITSVMTKIEASTKKTGGAQATLDKLIQRFGELQSIKLPDLSSLSFEKLEDEMESLSKKWDELDAKFANKKSSAYQLEKGKLLMQERNIARAYASQSGSTGAANADIADIDAQIKRIHSMFERAIAKLQDQISSDTFAQALSKQLNDVQIKLSVPDSAKEELKSKINSFVDEINNGGVKPAQIQIDYSFKDSGLKNGATKNLANTDVGKLEEMVKAEIDSIDKSIAELKTKQAEYKAALDANPHNGTARHNYNNARSQIDELTKQKQANEYLQANIHDEGVQRALTSTLNDFKAINKVISSQQSGILAETIAWRQKMVEAMKLGKSDIDFNFGIGHIDSAAESLLDELNAFFANNVIDININKEKLKNDLAEALGNNGASIGGTATIDPKTLVSAIATGLQAALTGDFTPVTDKGATNGAEAKAAVVPSKKSIYLDPQDPYNAFMGKEFIELAKYAQGKGKPAASLRSFFDMKGVDLKSIAEGENVMKALDALAMVIEKGGTTLESEFGDLIVGRNKLMSTFKTNLSELLYTQNIKQKTLSEDEISRRSIDIFRDFSTKQQLVSGISKIRNLKPENLASLKSEDIEDLTSIASGISEEALKSGNVVGSDYYKKIVNMLTALKTARESAGDLDDETKQQDLANTVTAFKQDIEQIYNDLLKYVKSFDMHAFVGGKATRVVGGSSGRSTFRLLNKINGDWSKLEDVTLQKFANNAPIGVMSRREEQMLLRDSSRLDLYRAAPDRTDILNKDVSIEKFEPKENTFKRWEDSTTAEAQASERESTATKLVEESQKRATSLANTEAELEQQIAAKIKQKIAIENEIAKNQKKIDKLVNDDIKYDDAQSRLMEIDKNVERTSRVLTEAKRAAEQARQEKEEANRLLQEVQKNDYSAIDAQNAKIARYEAQVKNPLKYRKDLIGEIQYKKDKKTGKIVGSKLVGGIYEDDYRNAMFRRDEASTSAKQTESLLANASYRVSNLEKQINKFGETPELRKLLDSAIREQKELQNKLSAYREEVDKNQAILNDIARKRMGASANDRRDFTADVKRKIGGYYDNEGNFVKGKLQHAQDYRKTLGNDLRDEVTARAEQARIIDETAQSTLKRAQSENNAALKEQKAAKRSDADIKTVMKVNELMSKNSELEQELTALNNDISIDKSIKRHMPQISESYTAKSKLTATEGLKTSIDSLINRQNELEQALLKQRAEADTIDKSVAKRMQQRAHKTPEYDIGYSKKENQIISQHGNYANRAEYLKLIASDTFKEGNFVPKNLTANMKQAIDSLINSRNVIKLFGENTNEAITKLGLDKFTSEADLQKEVKTRLDANAKNANKISPMLAEYYNRILTDGQNGALEWLQTQLSSSLKNIATQTQKLSSLSQADTTKAMDLKPTVDEADKNLQQMYVDRVNTWFESLQQKIALNNSREIIRSLGGSSNETITKLGLDKFASEQDVKKEVQARLTESAEGKSQIAPIVAEYYNKIINNGRDSTLKWLETTIEKNKSVIGSNGLSIKDSMLTTKEIEGLFGLIKKASSNYNKSNIKGIDDEIKKETNKLDRLRTRLEVATQSGNLDVKSKTEDDIEETENLIKQYREKREKLLLLTPEQEALLKTSSKYSYTNSLNQKIYGSQRELEMNRSNTEQQILARNSVLEARRAELLNQIKTTPSGTSTEELQKELQGINTELSKYQQYFAMLNINTLFADDVEFANGYKTKLSEIIGLEQQLDLAKATGAPTANLTSEIDTKQSALDQSMYSKLQTKQKGLLTDIGAFAKEGKSTQDLETSLKAVNVELAKYELTKRRIGDSGVEKELSLYGASEHVMRVYNELMKETIGLENELAIARAKSQDPKNDQAVIDAQTKLRKHNNNAKTRLQQVMEDQAALEAQGSARIQALEYLRKTEEAYQTAYEQKYTAKGRIKRVEGQLSDIAPDKSYWNSGLYKSHINTVKDKMVDDYVHSDRLKADRDAGYSKVEAEMKSYLEGKLGPEAAQQVLYQLTQSVAPGGEKIDPSKLMEAFVSLQTTSEGYAKYVATLQSAEKAQYEKDIAPYAKERDIIVNKAENELDLIRNASEKDYAPLQAEMDKIRSRVDVASIEKEFNQILRDASKRDKHEDLNELKSKLMSVARGYGADRQEVDDLYNVINSNISNIRHKKDQSWVSDSISRIFGMDEDRVRGMARANLEKQAQANIDRANSAYIKQDAKITTSLAANTQNQINKYLDMSVTKTVQALLANTEGIKDAEGVANKLNELMEKYVYNLVSNYAQSLSVGKNMPSGEEIRQEIERGLIEELAILRGERPELKPGLAQFEENITHIETQRKAAMEFGDIGRKDAADADILKQQAMFASQITTEKAKQTEMQAEIARLEKEGGQEERIAKLNAAVATSQEAINQWQMLINNRDNLIDLQHQMKTDEKAEKTYTPEQQKLWYTNALEAAKLNLDSEDPTKKRIAEESVARYTDLLNKVEAKIAEQKPEEQGKGGILGQLAGLLKGAGGIALDASGLASQATLEQIAMAVERILVTLGGDTATSVVKDPEIEGKLARMRELEEKYGGKPGQKVIKSGSETKSVNKSKSTPKTQFPENFDFKGALQAQAQEVAKYSNNTKEYILEQAKLYQLLWAYKNNTPELKGLKNTDFYARDEVKGLGLDENLNTADKRKEAYKNAGGTDDIGKLARGFVNGFKAPIEGVTAETNKQLDAEKAKTAETQKQVENEKKEASSIEKEKQANADGKIRYSKEDYAEYQKLGKETKGYKGGEIVRNETEGLSTGLAKDETLMKILDAINNIVKNGVTRHSGTKGGKGEAPVKPKTEAELIRDRALVNDEVVRKLSAGKAGLYDKYVKDVEDLNNAVKEANKADDKHKARAINKVKTTADKVTALGRNIIRDTEDWEYKSAQGTVLKSFKKKKDIDQTYMEDLAKQHGGVNKGQNQYKFLNFDGNTLTYQLTDIEGKVRQVTMEWNAFNKEIAITSDKSVGKLSGLAGKVDNLNTKFTEAKEMGYLHEQDKDLQAYYEQLKKIDEMIKNGASFADVDKERGHALALGGIVNSKIGKTKRLYNESELGKVDNQRRKIVDAFGSQEAFDESKLGIVQQYKQAYLDLQNTYKNMHAEKATLNASEQEAIRQQTVGVENLGRKVIRQAKEIQALNQAVENSGSYEDKHGNEILLGGTKEGLSATETAVGNLKNTMLDFAQNGLGHANIENAKFNKNTQTLTYNQRINKDTVAEMAVQYNKATNSLYAYNKQEKQSLTGWKGFMADMKNKGRSIFSYLAYTTSIYRIISVVRQGITYVKEIDAAMTELRKVTDETEESYDRFLNTASKIAGKVGSTTKEVVSSTADWARLNI